MLAPDPRSTSPSRLGSPAELSQLLRRLDERRQHGNDPRLDVFRARTETVAVSCSPCPSLIV